MKDGKAVHCRFLGRDDASCLAKKKPPQRAEQALEEGRMLKAFCRDFVAPRARE